MTDTPRFPRHSCSSCVFLGTLRVRDHPYDIYKCGDTGVVMRWGHYPFEYFAAQIDEFMRPGGIKTFRDGERTRKDPCARELNLAWAMAAKWWK